MVRWLLALIPAALGLALALWLNLGQAANPLIYLEIDLGSLLFGFGVLLSGWVCAILWIRDLGEKIRIDLIIKSAEDRRRFLRRLDHELKNPLTAILAGLANLSVMETPAERDETLMSVQTQVGRLRRLVADLRKLSELETRPLERGSVDMTQLLEAVFALTEDHNAVSERTLILSIPRAPWPLPVIQGDHDLLVLAFHNLLDNALKFTRPGDRIEMRASEADSYVVVEVADTGPGIPVNEIDHVWEELYRGEGARGVPGSGLGLALVRAIIARHDGSLTLRSRPGEGTVFTVRLPAGN